MTGQNKLLTLEQLDLIKEDFPHYEIQKRSFPERCYYAPKGMDSHAHYKAMVAGIEKALHDKVWFPILRVSHGEFDLLFGKNPPLNANLIAFTRFYLAKVYKVSGLSPAVSYGGTETNGESRERLKRLELPKIKRQWTHDAKSISQQGFIAANFHNRPDSQHRIEPTLTYFKKKDINVHKQNYVPFFGMYAFLCGPDFSKLLQDKNVVVVTWLNETRQKTIASTLREKGAASVDFIPVSPHRAAFDHINPAKLNAHADIALFACGLGSAKLICAFKNRATLCIDAGFALDVFANSKLKGKRAWTKPD